MKHFVPDEEGGLLRNRPVVICSELEWNRGAGATEVAVWIRGAEVLRLVDPIWIEEDPLASTNGRKGVFELVVSLALGRLYWKRLAGHCGHASVSSSMSPNRCGMEKSPIDLASLGL